MVCPCGLQGNDGTGESLRTWYERRTCIPLSGFLSGGFAGRGGNGHRTRNLPLCRDGAVLRQGAGEDGKPAAGARVRFEVLNMAGFHPVAVVEADTAGKVRLQLGLGSVLIVAAANGLLGEKLVNTAEERETVLVLSEKPPLSGWTEFDFIAPEDHPLSVVSLTAEQKRFRTQTLCRCAALRSGRARQGAEAETEEEALFLSLLTEKDRAAPCRRTFGRTLKRHSNGGRNSPGSI